MINLNKFIEDVSQEYSKIVLPKLNEVLMVVLMVIVCVVCVSLLINITDIAIGHIFNFIMF